jgi:hypothetical protein
MVQYNLRVKLLELHKMSYFGHVGIKCYIMFGEYPYDETPGMRVPVAIIRFRINSESHADLWWNSMTPSQRNATHTHTVHLTVNLLP